MIWRVLQMCTILYYRLRKKDMRFSNSIAFPNCVTASSICDVLWNAILKSQKRAIQMSRKQRLEFLNSVFSNKETIHNTDVQVFTKDTKSLSPHLIVCLSVIWIQLQCSTTILNCFFVLAEFPICSCSETDYCNALETIE